MDRSGEADTPVKRKCFQSDVTEYHVSHWLLDINMFKNTDFFVCVCASMTHMSALECSWRSEHRGQLWKPSLTIMWVLPIGLRSFIVLGGRSLSPKSHLPSL